MSGRCWRPIPKALIIRTSWLYGPGGPSFPATILRVARAGRPLHVVADQRGSPTYTVDLARATVELLEAGATGVLHLSNAGETTWHEFAEHTLQAFGLSAPVGKLSAAEWATKTPSSAARPARSTMDLSKAEAALGRKMRPWREALQDFARHPLAGK